MDGETYWLIGRILGVIAAVITFIPSWWYCAANYGFLLGFGIGWLPSGILAALVGLAVALLWGLAMLVFGILLCIGTVWVIFRSAH